MARLATGKDILYGGQGVTQVRDSLGRFAGAYGVEWGAMSLLAGNIGELLGARIDQILENIDALAAEIQDYMQSNAPWSDRTGDARASLQTEAVMDGRTAKIFLGYGQDIFYGYFLENFTYGGISYAIIKPTIEHYADNALARVTG